MLEMKPRAQRFPVKVPLKYRHAGTSEWLDGRTVNISRTGILFDASEEIPPRSLLEMRIDFPLMSRFSCHASVVRHADLSTLVAVKIQNYNLRRRRFWLV